MTRLLFTSIDGALRKIVMTDKNASSYLDGYKASLSKTGYVLQHTFLGVGQYAGRMTYEYRHNIFGFTIRIAVERID